MDAREECIRRANLIKRYYGYINFEFKKVDLRKDDLKKEKDNGAFDLVLCYGILYHLTDPYNFLKQVFKATKEILSLSTFLNHREEPVLTVAKEDISKPGSGLDHISVRPSHSAVVRLLYEVGFDLVLRYVPYKLSFYNNLEWGHYFGIKLGNRESRNYNKKHNIQEKYNRFTRKDQLIVCKDLYDINGNNLIGKPISFKPILIQYFFQKIKHKYYSFTYRKNHRSRNTKNY